VHTSSSLSQIEPGGRYNAGYVWAISSAGALGDSCLVMTGLSWRRQTAVGFLLIKELAGS
jgi:hypothetical protein